MEGDMNDKKGRPMIIDFLKNRRFLWAGVALAVLLFAGLMTVGILVASHKKPSPQSVATVTAATTFFRPTTTKPASTAAAAGTTVEPPTATPTPVATLEPTATPTPVPTAMAMPMAAACQDGKILANQANSLTRVPIAVKEGISVWELSWIGTGFGGFDRAVIIVPKVEDTRYAVHVLNAKTVHGVLYCGTMEAVQEWAPTHVDAMLITAQDDQGHRPAQEIGVYLLNWDGTLTVVKAAPKGPSKETFEKRLEVNFRK